jgi:hypothetical protein
MRGLRMNNNSLYIHVYYSFLMYYFNIKKVHLIDMGKREKVENNKIRVKK